MERARANKGCYCGVFQFSTRDGFFKRSLNWDKRKAFKFLAIWREFTRFVKTLHILMNVNEFSVRKDVLLYISLHLKLEVMDVQSIFHFIETILIPYVRYLKLDRYAL